MSVAMQQTSHTNRRLQRGASPQGRWDCRRLLRHASRVVLVLLLIASAAPLAQAQQADPFEPPRLCPKDGVLDVTLEVRPVEHDVQVVVKENQAYKVTTKRMK